MKTYEKVYQLLFQSQDYLSGEDLAESLQVSRTSIWKAIQQLEKQGLVIDSLKHRGYRLLEGDLLLPDWLAEQVPFTISFQANSQSTQLDAKKGIESGHPGNCLYLAPSQTGAKGRFGREFFAPQQGGIYMSLHLRPLLPLGELPAYTVLLAASIVSAIKDLTGIETQIKWVNDIYLGQKKIAGILTEAITSIENGLVTDVIMGVGLNVYIKDFPDQLKDKATSLFDQKPKIDRNQLIAAIWQTFLTKTPDQLLTIYKSHSLVLGKTISFQQHGQEISGLALDIDDQGQLLVQVENQTLWLNSGEISLSSWN